MVCIREILDSIRNAEVELALVSRRKAACGDLHLRIIGELGSVSNYLDSVSDVYIPGSEIEIQEYTTSPLSYNTTGWWTETHDMIPLMANNELSERKRKYLLNEFADYDRDDLLNSNLSERGMATLSHIWGKEIEQEAVQEVMNILQSTGTRYVPSGEPENFDFAYHSPHNFSRVEIHQSREAVRLFLLESSLLDDSGSVFSYYTIQNSSIVSYLHNSTKWKEIQVGNNVASNVHVPSEYSIAVADIMSHLQNVARPTSTERLCEIVDSNTTTAEVRQILEHLRSGGYLKQHESNCERDTDEEYWNLMSPQTEIENVISWIESAHLLDRKPGDGLSDVEKLAHIVDLAGWVDESPHPERTHIDTIERLQNEVANSLNG